MSLAAKKRVRAVPVMNVTPLVDVVLVLLIIFMTLVPTLEITPAVNLPNVANPDAKPHNDLEPYVLSVTADGSVYFEREPVAERELESVLHNANRRDTHRRLILRADRATAYAYVRRLFGICQAIGFPGLSLRVNARGPDDGSQP